MRSLARFPVAAMLTSLVAIPLSAQRQRAAFDGAWRHARSQVVAPDSSYDRTPLQGMAVVSGRTFSQTWLAPGPAGVQQTSQPSTPPSTPDEKAARYDALIANAGTLDITDSTITYNYAVAKSPRVMGTSVSRRYRLKGDTLWVMSEAPWDKDRTKQVRFTDTYVRIR